jgi:type II secretion system protein H
MPMARAFTLVELIMVIAVTGIIAAIAVPRYGNALSQYRVDVAARRIAADLALAQHRAKVAGASRTVTFNVAAASYQLTSIADFKKPAVDYTVNLSQSPYAATLTSVDMGGDTSITFNGYGVPDSGGSISVASGSKQRTVTVDATTGGATVQ